MDASQDRDRLRCNKRIFVCSNCLSTPRIDFITSQAFCALPFQGNLPIVQGPDPACNLSQHGRLPNERCACDCSKLVCGRADRKS